MKVQNDAAIRLVDDVALREVLRLAAVEVARADVQRPGRIFSEWNLDSAAEDPGVRPVICVGIAQRLKGVALIGERRLGREARGRDGGVEIGTEPAGGLLKL